MMRFVVKVMNNGNVDHLPVKAINMKEAIQKAKLVIQLHLNPELHTVLTTQD